MADLRWLAFALALSACGRSGLLDLPEPGADLALAPVDSGADLAPRPLPSAADAAGAPDAASLDLATWRCPPGACYPNPVLPQCEDRPPRYWRGLPGCESGWCCP